MPSSSTQPHGGNPYGSAFVVSPEDVLSTRAALLAEADDFRAFLDSIWGDLFMAPMGGDPVSDDVARGVTYRLRDADDSYFNVCVAWVENLRQTAETMAEIARQYGYTDEEIATSFTRGAASA